METETMTDLGAGAHVATVAHGCVELSEACQEAHPGVFILTLQELQALAQWAYDRHGILAEPSYTAEADRLPDVAGAIRDHVDAAHAAQAAHRAGVSA